MPIEPSAIGPIDGEVREAIRFLVASAQDVPNRETPELSRQHAGLLVQRNEIRMLHFVFALDLLNKQQRVGNDIQFRSPLGLGDRESLQQACIFSHVVRRGAEVTADFDDLAAIGCHVHPVTSRSGIAA